MMLSELESGDLTFANEHAYETPYTGGFSKFKKKLNYRSINFSTLDDRD